MWLVTPKLESMGVEQWFSNLGAHRVPPEGLVKHRWQGPTPTIADTDPAGLRPPVENCSGTCTELHGQYENLSSLLQAASLSRTLRVSMPVHGTVGGEFKAGFGRLREGPLLKNIFPTDAREVIGQDELQHLLHSQRN